MRNRTFMGWSSEWGGSPLASSMAVMPRDQISAWDGSTGRPQPLHVTDTDTYSGCTDVDTGIETIPGTNKASVLENFPILKSDTKCPKYNMSELKGTWFLVFLAHRSVLDLSNMRDLEKYGLYLNYLHLYCLVKAIIGSVLGIGWCLKVRTQKWYH